MVKTLRDDADKGNGRRQRVADGGVAAARVPPEQALRAQSQPDDPVLSLQESEGGRRKLDDVGAAVRIEQIGAAELVGKGLAIVAIADDVIRRPWRGVRDLRPDFTAAATQFHLIAHRTALFVFLRHSGMVRRTRPGISTIPGSMLRIAPE